MISIEQKILEEVMVFLKPHYKFIAYLVAKGKQRELEIIKKIIKDGLKSEKIIFHHADKALDIDIKNLAKEKGKAWVDVLRKQLKQLSEIG